ncbi:hypothetical protein C7441_10914 [Pseudaminobacter salicylatoxidans]|uniref:Uncharacterized protein n=1 Tax=Pseudaminobacter salicylatoxidans TaxID=93369 RepID=A0A316C2E4_PSESE|nr:hypothetical protein [Pseudaminobacter salicylatoxidans]PWJ82248.1 hypothetical protein C7441_10914 [Pseudaminobacter salicylatoxidans]
METPLRIRNVLFKAFIINLLVIIFAWLMSLSGVTTVLMSAFFGFSVDQTRMYMADIIGFWKVLNVVFFLIPAIAIHWEYRTKR